MTEFIEEQLKEAQIHPNSMKEGERITDHPAYVVVFLIHFLAHDMNFPSGNCQDENIFAQFCR